MIIRANTGFQHGRGGISSKQKENGGTDKNLIFLTQIKNIVFSKLKWVLMIEINLELKELFLLSFNINFVLFECFDGLG